MKAEFCETYFLFLEITPLLDICDYESFSSLGIRHSESGRLAGRQAGPGGIRLQEIFGPGNTRREKTGRDSRGDMVSDKLFIVGPSHYSRQ